MKKSKLIELLNNIKGNPDILFWNSFVGDWMDISPDLVEAMLVKTSLSKWIYYVELEQQVGLNDFDHKLSEEEIKEITKRYRGDVSWEDNELVYEEDVKSGDYKSKRVFYMQAKSRGINTHDRLGKISY